MTCIGCGALVEVVAGDHAATTCATCNAALACCLACKAEFGRQFSCTPCFDQAHDERLLARP